MCSSNFAAQASGLLIFQVLGFTLVSLCLGGGSSPISLIHPRRSRCARMEPPGRRGFFPRAHPAFRQGPALIVGIGIDLTPVARLWQSYERYQQRFLKHVLTEREQAEFHKRLTPRDPNAEVPELIGIAVLTDGDETHEESSADFGSFVFGTTP